MKTSIVVADPSFQGNTAPLLGSYAEVARQAAEIGFDAIQLTVNRPLEVPVQDVIRAVETHSLSVSSIATGLGYSIDGLSLGNKDESNRQAAADRMKEHIDLASRLGDPRVIIGAIRGWAKDSGSWDVFEGQFRKSVDEMLVYAEQKGITVIIEADDHFETDAYLSVKDTVDFIKSYSSPNFLLQLDSMHLLYEQEDTYHEIITNAPLIAQVDISDENRMVPDGLHFDFPLMMKALREIDYRDYLVFEYRADPTRNTAKIGFDYIKQLMRPE